MHVDVDTPFPTKQGVSEHPEVGNEFHRLQLSDGFSDGSSAFLTEDALAPLVAGSISIV